jgi:hypothetical protein
MGMSVPDIHFKTCTSAYNCLRVMATRIEQAHGDTGGWRILFQDGLRGFVARITTVMQGLLRLDAPFQVPADQLVPEQWAIDTDRLTGEIFFGMDSAIECFVFAMNAVGYLKSPAGFCDITTPAGLKRIRPDNMVNNNPGDKRNPLPGYAAVFPRIVAHWARNQPLIAEIMEYHDVSKHRSCIVFGATLGHHALPNQPKLPGSLYRTATRTVEEIAKEFHTFCESLMIETVEELSSVFEIPVHRTDYAT